MSPGASVAGRRPASGGVGADSGESEENEVVRQPHLAGSDALSHPWGVTFSVDLARTASVRMVSAQRSTSLRTASTRAPRQINALVASADLEAGRVATCPQAIPIPDWDVNSRVKKLEVVPGLQLYGYCRVARNGRVAVSLASETPRRREKRRPARRLCLAFRSAEVTSPESAIVDRSSYGVW